MIIDARTCMQIEVTCHLVLCIEQPQFNREVSDLNNVNVVETSKGSRVIDLAT